MKTRTFFVHCFGRIDTMMLQRRRNDARAAHARQRGSRRNRGGAVGARTVRYLPCISMIRSPIRRVNSYSRSLTLPTGALYPSRCDGKEPP